MSTALFNDDRRILLHVGCGTESRDALPRLDYDNIWREVRLDINPSVNPDIISSITDLSGVPDNSVSIVFSKHNIEHLEAHDVPKALASFFRVLKPEGFTIIRTPDLAQVAQLILSKGLDTQIMTAYGHPVTPLDIVYGLRGAIAEGNSFMAHRTGFTPETLRDQLIAAGFESVQMSRRPKYELGAIAQKVRQGNLFGHV